MVRQDADDAGKDDRMIRLAIFVLVGLCLLVIGAVVALAVYLARRNRRQ